MTNAFSGSGGNALIGIDTNVLLRFVIEDDPAQTDAVQSWLDERTSRDPGFVSLLVLCEFVWVLATRYGFSRDNIAGAVKTVLNTAVLAVEQAELAKDALLKFQASKADFADCCISAMAYAAGCDFTVTFDKAAAKLPGMRLLT